MAVDCSLLRVHDNRIFDYYAIALYVGLRMRNPAHTEVTEVESTIERLKSLGSNRLRW